MILHVIPNHRFISQFSPTFELAFPSGNRWFIIGDGEQLIKEDSSIFNNIEGDDFWGEFKKRLACKVDLICLHGLNSYNVRLGLRLVDEGYKVLPFLWAGEYSDLLSMNPLDPYMRETKEYLLEKKTFSRALYSRVVDATDGRIAIFKESVFGGGAVRQRQISLLNKVQYFVTPVTDEGEIIIKRNRLLSRTLYVPYSWVEAEVFDDSISTDSCDIQVGHSAWPLNNHFDAFSFVKDNSFSGGKVCCPLAYGDQVYLDTVEQRGRDFFGSNFTSQRGFIPRLDYFRGLKNVAIYIAAQRVQFGLGNVRNMVAMGKRVVMPKENPIFSHLKQVGIEVSAFDASMPLPEPLSSSSAHENKEVAVKYWSRDSVIREIQESIEKAIQD
ncbi:MAG: hypothetical protein ACSHYA_02870 [Opitutaceae bacterium]